MGRTHLSLHHRHPQMVLFVLRVLCWCCLCSCSVTKLCLILCNLMNCSIPGFPVLHYLPEFAQTHGHWVSGAIQPSHPLSAPYPPFPQSFPASGSFPVSQLFASGGQSIGASASASVLLENIQGWFSLGLTGLISLLSKGLSKVFSSNSVQKYHKISAEINAKETKETIAKINKTKSWFFEKIK